MTIAEYMHLASGCTASAHDDTVLELAYTAWKKT